MLEAIKWAQDTLASYGYVLNFPPLDIQSTPWSIVKCFSTTTENIYLKIMPCALSLEPIIIQLLREKWQAKVPISLRINKKLSCFLMRDAGISLRGYKQNDATELLCQAIHEYTRIQCVAVNHIDTFLKLGVPDWRLNQLPLLYHELINKKTLLMDYGLSISQLKILNELTSQFSALCDELSHFDIPETLDNCDFHDNNILIQIQNNTPDLTLIDWGETVITHPFFSLHRFLGVVAKYRALKETDEMFLKLKKACIDNFTFLQSKKNLLTAFSFIKKLQPIYEALGYYRLMTSVDLKNPKKIKFYFNAGRNKGRFANYFKMFIKNMSDGIGLK